MKLPQHNRYDYSPITERKDYSWPGGKRLAFCITTNIECFAFGKGRGHDNAKHGEPRPSATIRGATTAIASVYGACSIWWTSSMPLAHNTNSLLYDYAPQIFERLRQRGDEIVGHGRTNSENLQDFRGRKTRRASSGRSRRRSPATKGGRRKAGWERARTKTPGRPICSRRRATNTSWTGRTTTSRSGCARVRADPVGALSGGAQRLAADHPSPAHGARVLRHAGRSVRGDGRAEREASARLQHLDSSIRVRLSVPTASAAPGVAALLLEQVHGSRVEVPACRCLRLLPDPRARHRSRRLARRPDPLRDVGRVGACTRFFTTRTDHASISGWARS